MEQIEQPLIRPLEIGDADAAAGLSGQLGYPCSASDMYSRIGQILQSPERAVFAAVLHGRLVGWIDAAIERHLQSADMAIINGLVVDENFRGQSIGRLLCKAAEDWALARGLAIMRVRSNAKRADAHRFYQRDGYQLVKTSAVFEKRLR